jgi:heat shock protein HslJ
MILRNSFKRAFSGHKTQALAGGLALAVLIAPLAAQAQQRASRNARPPQPDEVAPQAIQKQFPVGFSWTLVSMNGKPPTGEKPTLTIDDNYRGTGFSGCNSYSATTFPIAKQGFAVGPVAVTRRACDAAVTTSERAFLVAFRTANAWDLLSGQLILKSGNTELRFERAI